MPLVADTLELSELRTEQLLAKHNTYMAVKGAARRGAARRARWAKMADLLFAPLYISVSLYLPATASNLVTFHCKN